jgi:hypothetical protein
MPVWCNLVGTQRLERCALRAWGFESLHRHMENNIIEDLWLIEGNRRRRAKYTICEECKKYFLDRLNGDKKFCSTNCRDLSRTCKDEYKCAYCEKIFRRNKSKTKNSKSGLQFCCRECKDLAQSIDGGIKEIQPDHYGNGSSGYRQKTFSNAEEVCCIDCGEIRRYLLAVHHIDSDRTNVEDNNLEIVCMNCHARRHLCFINNKWVFYPRELTSRELLDNL